MSFCPTKDIHSVYLDNEMSEIYKAEYESHIKTCPKCQAELNKLRSLRSLLNEDSSAITPDSHYLDESFNRLKIKLNYSKNTGRTNKASDGWKNKLPAAVAGVAAAAVFALVLPLGLKGGAENPSAVAASVSSVLPQLPSAANVSVGGGNGRVISGNINGAVLSSVSTAASDRGAFARKVNNGSSENNLLRDVDVFRPSFNEDKTISIKITVPGMNEIPVTTEIELPMEMSSLGQY